MSKSAYLVLSPHQDDELLSLSVPITNALAANLDVYVLLITDGAAASIREKLGLSIPEFISARDKEFINSCKKLGIQNDNIIIPDNRLPDGNFDIVDAIEFISPFIRGIKTNYDNLTIATISPYGPTKQHADHTTVGLAAIELKKDKDLKINKLELYLEPYMFDGNENYKVISPVNVSNITASANSYRHSKYRITGQLESKRISEFLSNCIAYKYKLSISNRIKNFFKSLKRPFENLFMEFKCKQIDFDPTKLTSYNIITNRPDLYRGNFETYEVISNGVNYTCLVCFEEQRAEICMRLSSISDEALKILCKTIFNKHRHIICININQTYAKIGISKSQTIYRLFLPSSVKVARGTYENFKYESGFITDEYALLSRKKVVASILTSEQCDVVLVNKCTDDCPDKLFNYLIKVLNEKDKTEIVIDRPLNDSVEETVYNCTVYKNHFI